jgi:hypothetical protein
MTIRSLARLALKLGLTFTLFSCQQEKPTAVSLEGLPSCSSQQLALLENIHPGILSAQQLPAGRYAFHSAQVLIEDSTENSANQFILSDQPLATGQWETQVDCGSGQADADKAQTHQVEAPINWDITSKGIMKIESLRSLSLEVQSGHLFHQGRAEIRPTTISLENLQEEIDHQRLYGADLYYRQLGNNEIEMVKTKEQLGPLIRPQRQVLRVKYYFTTETDLM